MHAHPRGFTLIELMIAVAIIAILTATAFPSYQSQVRKSRRSDAQAYAMDVVARQQQFLLDRRTYATSITAAPAANGLGMTIPASISNAYNVTICTGDPCGTPVAPPTFSVSLAPIGAQAADACGTLRVDQAGRKTATGTGPCW